MRTFLGAALGALLLALAGGVVAPAAAADAATDHAELLARGRALYVEGRRADGGALVAARAGGLTLVGAEAACANCHRRSGLGSSEGRSYIPPVTATALFTAMAVGKGASAIGAGRPAYDEASLGHALREGVDASGRRLDFLMPRYRLQDEEVRALQAYLASLPGASSAGSDVLHFATVIAPEVPREQGEAMVGVLQACFDEHNAGPQPERGRRKLAAGMSQREGRKWQLHVWNLEGPQEGWDAQLARSARAQPVFAVVGGVGRADWAPVHGFCERTGVPCVFPHLEAPVADAGGYYPLYLGKGALLEAGLVARHVAQQGDRAGVVTQVLREGDAAAQAAAEALQQALAEQGIASREWRLVTESSLDAGTFAAMRPRDTLVLWLRPADLQRLGPAAPQSARLYVSATLAQRDEVPLPLAWKERALMAYPFELPQQRTRRAGLMRQWLQEQGLALTEERVQADAWVACKALRTAMMEAEDHMGREYLVERLESNMERTTATGLYPRLALGIGQRFASKTGYLVRFDGASGGLVPVGERAAP